MSIQAIIILIGIVGIVMATEYYFTKRFREKSDKNKKDEK